MAAALLHPLLPSPTGITSWNGSDPAERFAIYRNNVTQSLVQALVDTFPVLNALVGDDFFCGMAKIFVRSHPPKSARLAFYGDAFPDFVATFEPALSLPYLADTGRLEMARVRTFHAADADPIQATELACQLQSPQVHNLRWTLHPSLQTLCSAYSIADIWQAHQVASEVSSFATHVAQSVWVYRTPSGVTVHPVPQAWVAFAEQLVGGENLPNAATALSSEADFSQALATLIQNGLITGCVTNNPRHN
jgi:hypothetical protein